MDEITKYDTTTTATNSSTNPIAPNEKDPIENVTPPSTADDEENDPKEKDVSERELKPSTTTKEKENDDGDVVPVDDNSEEEELFVPFPSSSPSERDTKPTMTSSSSSSSSSRPKRNNRVKMFQNIVKENWKNHISQRANNNNNNNSGGGGNNNGIIGGRKNPIAKFGLGNNNNNNNNSNNRNGREEDTNDNAKDENTRSIMARDVSVGSSIVDMKETMTSSSASVNSIQRDEKNNATTNSSNRDGNILNLFEEDRTTTTRSDTTDTIEKGDENVKDDSDLSQTTENYMNTTREVGGGGGVTRADSTISASCTSFLSYDSSSMRSTVSQTSNASSILVMEQQQKQQLPSGPRLPWARRQQPQPPAATAASNSAVKASTILQTSDITTMGKNNIQLDNNNNNNNKNTPIPPTNPSTPKREEVLCTVRPTYAYPGNAHMTESQLYKEMLQPSEYFEKLTSSTMTRSSTSSNKNPTDLPIGTLRVEVLSCLGLPKTNRPKPNPVVYLILGDVPFATDVISSTHSPIWPPRSKRAATFPLHHTYAKLYVGVVNATEADRKNDDFVGRTVVDIATLRPNSLYDVTLGLRPSAFVYDGERRCGVVRLRFSLHFNRGERAAVLSYLPSFRNGGGGGVGDRVTVPCADSKALRNVAFTVHGEDMPGTYSRKAWRATARETSLYQKNLGLTMKSLIEDTMNYENLFISSYIFVGWMIITYYSAIRMVPPFIVSFIITIFVENHSKFNSNENIHHGYKSATLKEICMALLFGSSSRKETIIKPLDTGNVEEHIEGGNSSGSSNNNMDGNIQFLKPQSLYGDALENPLMDHAEFPFAERRYGKVPIRDMLIQNSGNTTLSRLELRNGEGADTKGNVRNNIETESIQDENVDNSIVSSPSGEDDNVSRDSMEDQEISNSDSTLEIQSKRYLTKCPEQSDSVNPEQNEGKTFQDNFYSLEARMQKMTMYLFQKQASRPIQFSDDNSETVEVQVENEKGLLSQSKYANPLVALTAKFLEPVMKCVEVYLSTIRAGFSIATWRDPYISTWILFALIFLMIVLIMFPWRAFFFVVGVVGVGPQNLWFKVEAEKKRAQTMAKNNTTTTTSDHSDIIPDNASKDDKEEERKKSKFCLRKRNNGSEDQTALDLLVDNDNYQRPLFKARVRNDQKGNKKRVAKYTPQEVIIPYSPLRHERFFDWPPYPSVSLSTDITGMEEMLSIDSFQPRNVGSGGDEMSNEKKVI